MSPLDCNNLGPIPTLRHIQIFEQNLQVWVPDDLLRFCHCSCLKLGLENPRSVADELTDHRNFARIVLVRIVPFPTAMLWPSGGQGRNIKFIQGPNHSQILGEGPISLSFLGFTSMEPWSCSSLNADHESGVFADIFETVKHDCVTLDDMSTLLAWDLRTNRPRISSSEAWTLLKWWPAPTLRVAYWWGLAGLLEGATGCHWWISCPRKSLKHPTSGGAFDDFDGKSAEQNHQFTIPASHSLRTALQGNPASFLDVWKCWVCPQFWPATITGWCFVYISDIFSPTSCRSSFIGWP